MSKTLILTIELNDGLLWGRIENVSELFIPTGQGNTLEELEANIKEGIVDYLENEGKDDKNWKKIDLNNIEFEVVYDLEAFFEQHKYLNLSQIAKRARINRSLLNQYAIGQKKASSEQTKKIEIVIHEIGKELETVKLA